MKTAVIREPGQLLVVANSWGREVEPGVADGKAYELTLKLRRDSKTRAQEERYHAMIGDIAKQFQFYGKLLPPESIKRVMVDAFRHDTKDDPDYAEDWAKFGSIELVPALNHPGFVMVGEQTRRFSLKLAMGFITFLLAFGAEHDIKWSTPKSWGDAPET